MCAQLNTDSIVLRERRQSAIIKIGCGLYLHGMSTVFMSGVMNGTDGRMPFAFTNMAALQLDIIGIIQLVRIRREEKKLYKSIKLNR